MNTPSPDTPPMPWPFSYPDKFPKKPWLNLSDGQRLSLPLIGGWVGTALFQAGYTISQGSSIGANDRRLIGITPLGNMFYAKVLFVKTGITSHPEGLDLWETITLPKFLSRTLPDFEGNARPTLTVTLKPRGPLGWNTVLSIRYEDLYTVKADNAASMQGSSGVYITIGVQRILVPVAVVLGVVVAAPYLKAGVVKGFDYLKTGVVKLIEFVKEAYSQPLTSP